MEPTTGIEPVNLFLTKEVLYLLSYVGPRWSGKRDSNPQPSAWKADALAIELFPQPEERWWRGEDSNLRRLRRQIYSLLPLAAREPLRSEI
jgi:hypothetical protein